MTLLPQDFSKVKVPPLKIQGIKTKLVPFIASNIAWNGAGTYIEPFMGSGVVGFNLAPQRAIFADTNPHIINFYSAIQRGEVTSSLVRQYLECESPKLRATPDDKNSYFYEVRDRFNQEHSPLDFLFLQRANFNGMLRFNKSGKYNVPFGRKPERFAPALITKITNQVLWVENLLKEHPNWKFTLATFEETLQNLTADDFVYMDPPYLGRHDGYYDAWSEEKANLLRKLVENSDAGYALSMWDKNKYRTNKHLDTWNKSIKLTQEHFYHVGGKELNRASMTEALMVSPSHLAIHRPCPNFAVEGCLF